MAGGTQQNRQISQSVLPTQQRQSQNMRRTAQQQQPANDLGNMTTDMGMGQQAAWGGLSWGSAADNTPAYGGVPTGGKGFADPTRQQSPKASPMPEAPTYEPVTFNMGGGGWGTSFWGSNQGGQPGGQQGGQQSAPPDLWAIAGGQQQYGAPPPQQQQQALPAQQMTPGTQVATAPANATQSPGMDLATWMGLNNNGGQRRSLAEYSQLMQPYLDRAQNAYQWGNEFNEQQRRWDTQNSWQQGLDSANVELAFRQQGMSEEQARVAAAQWNQQFQQTVRNDTFNQGLATRDQDLAELQNRQQYGLQDRQVSLQELQNQQRYGLDTRAADLAELQNQQRYGIDTRAANLAERTQADLVNYRNQQDALGWGQIGQERYATDAETGLGYANVGQQRYATDVGAALQRQQMLQQMGIDTRTLDLRQQEQLANQMFQRQQLAQQAALQREQMALQERLGTMQAYGRAQAPQAKFIRSW